MTNYSIGLIGVGENPEEQTMEGFSMGYRHAEAYENIEGCEIVAVADVIAENARTFADLYDIADEHVYDSHKAMLANASPDIVSVCVPPSVHADIAIDCIRSEVVDLVYCEKPMAATWGECRLMAQEADRHDSVLAFNHQRRFGKPFRKAKDMLEDGVIGDLQRIEFNDFHLYDSGSHAFDLASYYNDERPADWVIGNIDYRTESVWFGAHNENHAVGFWEYDNGVMGFADVGDDTSPGGESLPCFVRLCGSEGAIELISDEGEAPLKICRTSEGWQEYDCAGEGGHEDIYYERAIRETITAVDEGHNPELSARNALNGTELIFGIWQSAQERGRIDLPLTVENNPLETMVRTGDLTPESIEADHRTN